MTVGLSPSRLVNVSVAFPTTTVQFLNLAAALIVGQSDVIDTTQRLRSYSSLAAVSADFGNTAPEYLAAQTFFAANPQPQGVLIGRWAQSATAGRLMGGALSTTQQAIANFTAVTAGALKLSVDGGAVTQVTGINLSGVTSLSGVASAVQTALVAATLNCTVTWTGSQFVIKSSTTGSTSAVTMPVAPASGTNIASIMGLTSALGAYAVQGIAAESLLSAVQALDTQATSWYWLNTDACTSAATSDVQAVSAYIQAAATPHMYGITSSDPNALSSGATSDIGYLLSQSLSASSPARTFGQYSAQNPYAVCGMIGRGCTINWGGTNTAINFMYQTEGGVVAETLGSAQADALKAKNYNVLANYTSGSAILQYGATFGPNYIDEVVGSDWLANYIQTNLIAFLGSVGTKIPQTDPGMHLIVNNITSSLAQAVTNGLVAPGTWTAAGFGQLANGQYLPTGFYIYCPPIASQSTADRAARKSVPIQIAAKLAGAVDTVNVTLNFNR